MDVLLVVDMQESALRESAQHDLSGVVVRINSLARRVRSGGGTVIFVQHDGPPGDEYEPFSPGWQLAAALEQAAGDLCIRKTVNDAFHETELESTLLEIGVTRLLIGGWATDFYVDSTVRSAAARGFDVVAVADCHTLDNRPHLAVPAVIEHHNWVWSNLMGSGSVLVIPECQIHDT